MGSVDINFSFPQQFCFGEFALYLPTDGHPVSGAEVNLFLVSHITDCHEDRNEVL